MTMARILAEFMQATGIEDGRPELTGQTSGNLRDWGYLRLDRLHPGNQRLWPGCLRDALADRRGHLLVANDGATTTRTWCAPSWTERRGPKPCAR